MLFVPRSLWHIAFFPAARHTELVSVSHPLPKLHLCLNEKKQKAIPR
jgi:hypothetical protein